MPAMLLAAAAALSVVGSPTPVELDQAALAAMPQVEAAARFHGGETRCRGPLLSDVLKAAGVPQGNDVRGPLLVTGVVAEAADGYRVLFSLGELDPMLGRAPVIVALSCGGAALSAEDGPLRILAGGDTRGARSVRQLVRLRVTTLP
jgi:hypothetical protein